MTVMQYEVYASMRTMHYEYTQRIMLRDMKNLVRMFWSGGALVGVYRSLCIRGAGYKCMYHYQREYRASGFVTESCAVVRV